jgi:hypothetical protein
VTCLRELYSSKTEAEETDSPKRIFDVYSHFIAPESEISTTTSVNLYFTFVMIFMKKAINISVIC